MTQAARRSAHVEGYPQKHDRAQSSAQPRALQQRRRWRDARPRERTGKCAVLEREHHAAIGVAAENFQTSERDRRRLQVGHVQLVHEHRRSLARHDRRRFRHAHLDERRELRLRLDEAREHQHEGHNRKPPGGARRSGRAAWGAPGGWATETCAYQCVQGWILYALRSMLAGALPRKTTRQRRLLKNLQRASPMLGSILVRRSFSTASLLLAAGVLVASVGVPR